MAKPRKYLVVIHGMTPVLARPSGSPGSGQYLLNEDEVLARLNEALLHHDYAIFEVEPRKIETVRVIK